MSHGERPRVSTRADGSIESGLSSSLEPFGATPKWPGGPGTGRAAGGPYPAARSGGTRDLAKPTGGTHNVRPPNVGGSNR